MDQILTVLSALPKVSIKVLEKHYNISTKQVMNAEEKGATKIQWENVQSGKWDFWYFNSVIIVKLVVRIATEGCLVVEIKKDSERDSWFMKII